MTRRIASALAAVAVLAVGTLAPATPAAAGPAPGALCTIEEWHDPSKMAGCAAKARQQLTQAANCLNTPTPTSPHDGIAGWVTSEPDSAKRSGHPGRYSDFGVAGYSLITYDLSCAGAALHPDASMTTKVADFIFALAATIIGVDNSVREEAYNPGGLWGWSDKYIADLDHTFFTGLFGGILSLSFICVGCYLVIQSRRGNMSRAAGTAGWAIGVTVLCTVLLQWPTQAAHVADVAGSGTLQVTHQLVGPREDDTPPGKCVLGPEACADHRSAATRSSDTVTDAVLYQNWLRATLGSSDSETAKTYGEALFEAQAFTWGEVDASTDPATKAVIVARKQQQWMDTAAVIKAQDPTAYEHLQGLHDTDRIGAALIALVSAMVFSSFDLIASLIILLAFAVIRFVLAAAPILGSVGAFHRTAGPFIKVMAMAQAALVNVAVYGLTGALFLFFVDLIFNASGLPGPMQLALMGMAVIVSWLLFRPLVRLRRGAGDTRAVKPGIVRTVFDTYVQDGNTTRHAPGNANTTPSGGTAWNRPE